MSSFSKEHDYTIKSLILLYIFDLTRYLGVFQGKGKVKIEIIIVPYCLIVITSWDQEIINWLIDCDLCIA